MKKAKRRIVALATSITMAFVLVAAMVPATVSKAAVTSINATVTIPNVGDEIKEVTKGEEPYTYKEQDPRPTITVSTEGIEAEGYWTTGDKLYGVDGEESPIDRKSTRLNSSHPTTSRMPSSA